MFGKVDNGNLSAWKHWKLASFDAPGSAKSRTAESAPPTPKSKRTIAELSTVIRQAAHAEGFRQGQTEGYAAGRVTASAKRLRFSSLTIQLDAALAAMDQQIAEDLFALALEIARQVVGQAIPVKPSLIISVLQEALTQMPSLHAVIHLHPQDASFARTFLGEQLQLAGQRIIDDPHLVPGACSIEPGHGQPEAGGTTLWKGVAECLGANSDWLTADIKEPLPQTLDVGEDDEFPE